MKKKKKNPLFFLNLGPKHFAICTLFQKALQSHSITGGKLLSNLDNSLKIGPWGSSGSCGFIISVRTSKLHIDLSFQSLTICRNNNEVSYFYIFENFILTLLTILSNTYLVESSEYFAKSSSVTLFFLSKDEGSFFPSLSL